MVMGKEPRATIDAVRMGRKKMFASSAKAEHELGYRVLPVEDALRRAIDWFQAHGYVEPEERVVTVNA
jgi:dihydroflavonol-4-reductase